MKADLEVLLPSFERALSPAAEDQLADVQRVSEEIATGKKPITPAERAVLKAKRKEIRERMSAAQPEAVDVEFFTVLTFSSIENRNRFMDKHKFERKLKYVDGAIVRKAIQDGKTEGN